MKLGVFTVSMPDYSPEECLEKLHELAYDGVEWRITDDNGDSSVPDFWSGNRSSMNAHQLIKKADGLKKLAASLNISMPSIAAYIDCSNLDDVKLHCEATQAIGADNVRISPGIYDENKNYIDQVDYAKRQYAKTAEIAERYGVRVVIETHMGQLGPSMTKVMEILKDLPSKHVGIMWDPGNQIAEGMETYNMALDIAGEYLAEIHIKNLIWECCEHNDHQAVWQASTCPVHKGIVDWPKLIAVLKKRNYDQWLFFEDFSTEQPLDIRLKENLKWFRELIAAV